MIWTCHVSFSISWLCFCWGKNFIRKRRRGIFRPSWFLSVFRNFSSSLILLIEPLDIGYHRKQVLVKAFYLCEPEELDRMDGVIFKLFCMKQRGILMIEEFRQLVYHSIIFFSQKDEHVECSDDLNEVISRTSKNSISVLFFHWKCKDLQFPNSEYSIFDWIAADGLRCITELPLWKKIRK